MPMIDSAVRTRRMPIMRGCGEGGIPARYITATIRGMFVTKNLQAGKVRSIFDRNFICCLKYKTSL